jgi:hypothetical protein
LDNESSGNDQRMPFAALKIPPISILGEGDDCKVIISKASLKVPLQDLCGNPERVTAFGEGNFCQLTGKLPDIANLLNRVGR